MYVPIYVYISKHSCSNATETHTDRFCMNLYTCVCTACNQEVVGSSPTRGEPFSRKFRSGWLFITHTYMRIYLLSSKNFWGPSCISVHVYVDIEKKLASNIAETHTDYIYPCVICISIHIHIYVYIIGIFKIFHKACIPITEWKQLLYMYIYIYILWLIVSA